MPSEDGDGDGDGDERGDGKLPPNWKKVTDAGSRTYFHNILTNENSWERRAP